MFYVAGRKAKLGAEGMVEGNFYVPEGTIEVNSKRATGSFLAKRLRIGKGSIIELESFLTDVP